jgi:diadenylate cyclase
LLEGLLHLFSRRPAWEIARDFLDIGIVALVVYRALLVLRGTRAQQMGIGLLVISGVYAAAKFLGFVTVLNLLSAVLSSIVLIVVVVFQNDIRRALIRVGDRAWLPVFSRAQETRVIEEVVAAATELARHRVGALIAFEQDANLDEFVVGQGIPMESQVSRELLVTLFQPESINKLHDGAVVLRNYRIASAGVFFPMPETRNLDASLGSRHRAALGITEETDAVVIVVSEERGTITVCFRGNMIPNLDGQKLRTVLLDLFGHKQRGKPARRDDAPRSRPGPLSDGRRDPALLHMTPVPVRPPSASLPGPISVRPPAPALAAPMPASRRSDPPSSVAPGPLRREEGS